MSCSCACFDKSICADYSIHPDRLDSVEHVLTAMELERHSMGAAVALAAGLVDPFANTANSRLLELVDTPND